MTVQPFTLNHNGETLEEVFGKTAEELAKDSKENLDLDNITDELFAIVMYRTILEDQRVGVVLTALLSPLIGIDMGKKSEITEYLVRTIKDNEDRKNILKVCMAIKVGLV